MLYTAFYGLLAFLASAGGSLLALKGGTRESVLKKLVALSGGMLFAAAFLRIIPEAFHLHKTAGTISLLLFFLLFYSLEDVMMLHTCPEHMEHCSSHVMGKLALLGLSLHSLVDGIAVGSTFKLSLSLGLSASFSVIFHKFADGLSLSSLLLAERTSTRRVLLASLGIAFFTFIGAISSYTLLGRQPSPVLLASLLGISSASFIYISASDLLPTLHTERDISLSFFVALGMAIIGVLTLLFPAD